MILVSSCLLGVNCRYDGKTIYRAAGRIAQAISCRFVRNSSAVCRLRIPAEIIEEPPAIYLTLTHLF